MKLPFSSEEFVYICTEAHVEGEDWWGAMLSYDFACEEDDMRGNEPDSREDFFEYYYRDFPGLIMGDLEGYLRLLEKYPPPWKEESNA